MIYLIPKNCLYILGFTYTDLDVISGQFTKVKYSVSVASCRSTRPVTYDHAELVDWTSETGKALKAELDNVFPLLWRNRVGTILNHRFKPLNIEKNWTIFVLPKNSMAAKFAIYYSTEAMRKVPEYPGERV